MPSLLVLLVFIGWFCGALAFTGCFARWFAERIAGQSTTLEQEEKENS